MPVKRGGNFCNEKDNSFIKDGITVQRFKFKEIGANSKQCTLYNLYTCYAFFMSSSRCKSRVQLIHFSPWCPFP